MVFKLVRIDAEEPSKIQLTVGTHLFGRGKFLNCDDKRVSRRHGELIVTCDSVVLKALHHNPCFYTKKGSTDRQILKENCTYNLNNGDQFGLLPDSYWYEVLFCQSLDSDVPDVNANRIVDQVSQIQSNTQDRTQNLLNESQESLNLNMDETTNDRMSPSLIQQRQNSSPESDSTNELPQGQKSPSLLPQDGNSPLGSHDPGIAMSPSYTQPDSPQRNGSPSLIQNNQSPQLDTPPTNSEQSKRKHSPDSPVDVKKVKTEPVEVKQEPAQVKQEPAQVKQEPDDVRPGPSGEQNAQSNNSNNGAAAMPPSPTKPDQQPQGSKRERCMYGARCYRKNPRHKDQFSHPGDPDWGSGERGECPWGAHCRRQDPRHWAAHNHPPGTVPPQPRVVQQRRKEKRQKRERDSSDEDVPIQIHHHLIVTGKRQRKVVKTTEWSDDEEENEDPFQTDESDEWQPGSEAENTQSQGFTQDFLD